MGLTIRPTAKQTPPPPLVFLPPELQGPAWSRWAEEEFGHAQLGNSLRTARLVAIAARVGLHPAGTVTETFGAASTERELAYDWLENDNVSPKAVARASHEATARSTRGLRFVFVPVDGSSAAFTDRQKNKGMGHVGTITAGARGLKFISAIAVSPEGVPLGLLAQKWWVRTKRVTKKAALRRTQEKETQHWLDVSANATEVLEQQAPGVEPWFQYDDEGNAWPVLDAAAAECRLMTVRVSRDRRLWKDEDGQEESASGQMLWEKVQTFRVAANYTLEVTGTPERKARSARMNLRFGEVTLRLRDARTKEEWPQTMDAVWVKEQGTTPRGEEPLEWLLLTTYPVETVEDAFLVVFGYTQRWRIEEYHEALKTGGCHVEDSQLRAAANIERWAVIHSAVAMRVLRMAYLARHEPLTPASEEFSEGECAALVIETGVQWQHAAPTMYEAVEALARVGGYTGRSSGGPPGFTVLIRGLKSLRALASALERGAIRVGQADPSRRREKPALTPPMESPAGGAGGSAPPVTSRSSRLTELLGVALPGSGATRGRP
jgi:hypothetical protein